MGNYDFSKKVDRHGTDSLKYDFALERGRPEDVLPLWVADMDFSAPPCVNESLEQAVRFGVYGYTETKPDYDDAVTGWFKKRFGWQADASWMVKAPGVVFALAMAIRALTSPGDAVLIQPPVYYSFFSVIQRNDRLVAENPLILQNGRYQIDFADFEQKITAHNVKMFLLCSPHNPVGRVWTQEELQRIGEICFRHHVYVVSDEIHCDLVLPGNRHSVFLSANPALAEQTVVCTSPSKTFNLAGLQNANIFIPDPTIREAFCSEVKKTGSSQLNMMGLYACKAAYRGAEEWLEHCLAYLNENLEMLRLFLKTQLPQIQLVEPQGTYFAWLDFSQLQISDPQINDLVTNKAKLWLDAGRMFGQTAGSGFQRLNYACHRDTLLQALTSLKTAVHSL